MPADLFTPVGIYLRLRDHFRDTVLLESTDYHTAENSWSFICINAIGGIEIISPETIELKFPGFPPEKHVLNERKAVYEMLWDYLSRFDITESQTPESAFAQGVYGYLSYDAVPFIETIRFRNRNQNEESETSIPLARYRLYQYIIAINHFKDELFLIENRIRGVQSETDTLESLIKSRNLPLYPFRLQGEELSDISDDRFCEMVKKGISSCYRGDVFQIVLSRRFRRRFTGDEFNVYRALRSINPSPYLFYFDYGDYRLMGSSPESQLIIRNGEAVIHPIAGTFSRTGNDMEDKKEAERLLRDQKENAEHVMLVDLARNDLSRFCEEVHVSEYRQVHFYSHVIHLVSEVKGRLKPGYNPFEVLCGSFPAGTLSGAPKYRAMELIDEYEPVSRSFYGGAIGFTGMDGRCNHAIMIRTFLSKNNFLTCQAGAGVVALSRPESELQEVNNKLAALRKAVALAETL
ncbi:MAG: anthranilate synthase component I family protein [Chitinophagaceae bacterium]|nr:anthranilate synthase component I family protein [Chitinophagaceae bacterium]